MLIDSHCHVLSLEYEDVDNIIKNCIDNNISKIIVNGYDLKSSMEAVELSKKYDIVYAAVGIGPENIEDVTDKTINEIDILAKNNKKVVAIGEIGLDYYWTIENKEKQINVFNSMLKIAEKNNLPVIIHNREATKDVLDYVKKYNVTGIIHCFSGSVETANEFIKQGFLIGIGGVVTFKKSKLIKEVVRNIDLKNISLETDSPYLSPEPLRGKVNEPKNLIYIVSKIAELKETDESTVIKVTGDNVLSKFDLK